jgi:hypothetical protein
MLLWQSIILFHQVSDRANQLAVHAGPDHHAIVTATMAEAFLNR